jgi:uncharacterized phage protein (TIGR02220 family)
METTIKLNDIADDLLILNKMTIDTLFRLDNCADCISLYVFYYKTAKWQKTNTIKANDLYVKKSLKWGIDKIKRTKAILKEHGLINIVQRRKDGKIEGWYIEVAYLVTQRNLEDVKIKVEDCNNTSNPPLEPSTIPIINNTYNQQVDNPTSGEEDINALKEVIKSLKKEIKMLKNNKEDALKEETNKETAIVPLGEIDYDKIVNRLNELTGASFWSDSQNTRKLIKARFNEGFKEEDFMIVIEKMNYLWNKEPKKGEKDMRLYLRPSTLFGNKFEQYLNMNVQQRNLTTGDLLNNMDFSDFHIN